MMASFMKPLCMYALLNKSSASIPQVTRNPVPFGLTGSSTVLYCKHENFVRNYKKTGRACDSPCRRALKDIPKKIDLVCPAPCEEKRPKKKKGILYKIKLKLIEGGTNFGMPFRRLECKDRKPDTDDEVEKEEPVPAPVLVPKEDLTIPSDPRPGVQVSILGADTAIGQYCALLLKQCPHVRKLRLYQANKEGCACPPGNITDPSRDMYNVAQDLLHIDTNCGVQAFSCCNPCDLELSLQNTDIVLILENGNVTAKMPPEKRFECTAPMVKMYADAIASECPKAMVLVCATPIDCMVPLVAETMKEMGWYDKRKVIGSMAVQEMRASTLAARALCLDPHYTRVPCVGGTEGQALVPLFSKAISYFDFSRKSAELMTETVRSAPVMVTRCESSCNKSADLSEAHALAGLVKNVAHALLCQDIPKISGFVETDASQVISPARYLALDMLLNRHGICKKFDLPVGLSEVELELMDGMWGPLMRNVAWGQEWHKDYFVTQWQENETQSIKNFNIPTTFDHIKDCSTQLSS